MCYTCKISKIEGFKVLSLNKSSSKLTFIFFFFLQIKQLAHAPIMMQLIQLNLSTHIHTLVIQIALTLAILMSAIASMLTQTHMDQQQRFYYQYLILI